MIHGGDIYHNKIALDFSVNTNPLPCPEEVLTALRNANDLVGQYPEYGACSLRKELSLMEGLPDEEYVLCGSGASELFLAIAHTFLPRKALLLSPGFFGYEYVLTAVNAKIQRFVLNPEQDFQLSEAFLEQMTEELDCIFLASPNNPTGRCISQELLERILEKSKEKGITLVLDECFALFSSKQPLKRDWETFFESYPNVILVRAFTKSFSLPGVRIGYLLAAPENCRRIAKHLPEWNLSVYADAAGKACVKALMETAYIEESRRLIENERDYLQRELKALGLKVFESDTNFILFFCEQEMDLKEELLRQEILIRDCSNFDGLKKGYYRIAVKGAEENAKLIEVLKPLLK